MINNKNKILKICIFHIEFAYSGGAEKIVFKQLEYLSKISLETSCYTCFLDRKNVYPEEFKKYNIKQILPEILNKFIPHEIIILLTVIFFPLFLLRFKRFDLFIGENQPGPFLAFMAAKLFKKPYLAYINWPPSIVVPRKIDLKFGVYSEVNLVARWVLNFNSVFIRVIDKLSIVSADAILGDGKYVSEVCKNIYKRNVVNCPAGVEATQKIFSREERLKGEIKINNKNIKKPYILITNRHFPKKCFEYGLWGLQKLLKKGKNLVLVISGKETFYTNKIKNLAKELGIENSVIFLGYVKDVDLKKLYNNSLMYLYTALEEDFGMGVIEAMGCGVPVVAWNAAGPSRVVITGKTGFLAKPYSEKDFTQGIEYLVNLRSEKYKDMSLDSFNLARENYSWENHFKIFQKAMDEIYVLV